VFGEHNYRYWQTSGKNQYLSTISRLIKVHHPDWFHASKPHITTITPDLIDKIRALHMNISELKS
jgi:hypothetical protein